MPTGINIIGLAIDQTKVYPSTLRRYTRTKVGWMVGLDGWAGWLWMNRGIR